MRECENSLIRQLTNSRIPEFPNSTMNYPTLDTLDVSGKTVFVRLDLNVSFTDDGQIRDDARIQAALPTIKELKEKGAKLVLASHLGRPKGEPNPKYSLVPVGARLAELLDADVLVPETCVGMETKKLIKDSRDNTIVLLENLRFHEGETKNDDGFAKQLANLADIYVTDAFGALHRAHASTEGMVKHFKEKAIGRLVEKELKVLGKLLEAPEKPFVVMLGGAKVSDKIAVIESLMKKANKILIGGGMAYTFLKAQGYDVGKSLVEKDRLTMAKKILERAAIKGVEIVLPQDHLIADNFSAEAKFEVKSNKEDWGYGMGLDIGPKTIEGFQKVLSEAATVFWNGPMGVYEFESFSNGSLAMAKALASCNGFTVVGGGDSLAAVNDSGVADQINHLSTGGGASLAFLEGEALPGLKVLL